MAALKSELSTCQKDNVSLLQQIAKLRRELQQAQQRVNDIQQSSVVLRTGKATDLDQARWKRASDGGGISSSTEATPTKSANPSSSVNTSSSESTGDRSGWDFSEPGAVSRLMSILEGQVTLLDQELE